MAIAPTRSLEMQLFEPLPDALYTIDATARLANVSRRAILVYCKHHLLSPATGMVDHGYYFDGDAIRTLHRIEALRGVCGDDLAGIKMILDLNAALKRMGSEMQSLWREKSLNREKERGGVDNFVSRNKHEIAGDQY